MSQKKEMTKADALKKLSESESLTEEEMLEIRKALTGKDADAEAEKSEEEQDGWWESSSSEDDWQSSQKCW